MSLDIIRPSILGALAISLMTTFAVALPADAQNQSPAPGIAASKAELLAMTAQWKGDRFDDGRPKVPDSILERLKAVQIAYGWDVLRSQGYHNQFESGWKILHPDKSFIGRALTAAYVPSRPDLEEHILRLGKAEKRSGKPNSWPIDMLEKGDVYVADALGKVIDSTLIGDKLGTAIYSRSGNGVVFHGSARKREGLLKIEGFNAFVRDWDPSEIKELLMTSINQPICIGRAIVMPGDVIVARFEGVLVIPPHLAEEVALTGEITAIKDEFSHTRLREGKYTPGQIDAPPWSDAMKADFFEWYKMRKNNPPIPQEEIRKRI
jgi:regulator of RNase E activity RraA